MLLSRGLVGYELKDKDFVTSLCEEELFHNCVHQIFIRHFVSRREMGKSIRSIESLSL